MKRAGYFTVNKSSGKSARRLSQCYVQTYDKVKFRKTATWDIQRKRHLFSFQGLHNQEIPFSVFYTIESDEIVVHSVFDNRQHPEKRPRH